MYRVSGFRVEARRASRFSKVIVGIVAEVQVETKTPCTYLA